MAPVPFSFLVASVFAIGAFSASPAAAQTTALVLNSQPGDWVGGGVTKTLTPAEGTFTAARLADNALWVNFDAGSFGWHLYFAAPDDAILAVGVYENSARYPFHPSNTPGLDVHGEGRGCNSLSGRFSVLEVIYGPGGEVERFAATFEQHCENASPALLGSILYNATVTPPPPQPSHCPSAPATVRTLIALVNNLAATQATRSVLFPPLFAAQAALADGSPRVARAMMGVFAGRAIAVSNLDPADPNALPVGAGNVLVCASGNVLTNIFVP